MNTPRRTLGIGLLLSMLAHLLLIGGARFSLPQAPPAEIELTLMPPAAVPRGMPLPPAERGHGPWNAPAQRMAAQPAPRREWHSVAPPIPIAAPQSLPLPAEVPSTPAPVSGEARVPGAEAVISDPSALARPSDAAAASAATLPGVVAGAAPDTPLPDPGATGLPTALAPPERLAAAAPQEPAVLPEAVADPLAQLPREGEVDYQVTLGTGDWALARGTLRWKVDQSRYHVDLEARTVGLARLLKSNPVRQVSEGRITPAGLLPDQFRVIGRTGSQDEEGARFDWQARTLTLLPSGQALALPEGTQDLLSFFFQFALRPPAEGGLNHPVTNGRKLDSYAYELTDRTRLKLPMGEVETVHISRLHAISEDALEIWLAQDRHFLPVQMRFYARGRLFTLYATGIRIAGLRGAL